MRIPRFPVTGDTEFVRLDLHTSDAASFETVVPKCGEGNSLPGHVIARALRPGSGVLWVTAVDALNEPIPNVTPLKIELTVSG